MFGPNVPSVGTRTDMCANRWPMDDGLGCPQTLSDMRACMQRQQWWHGVRRRKSESHGRSGWLSPPVEQVGSDKSVAEDTNFVRCLCQIRKANDGRFASSC